MKLMNSVIRVVLLAGVYASSACGASTHVQDEDAGNGADASVAADAASADATTTPDATTGLPDLGAPVFCETDSDCNDDPAVSSLRGECFEGQCFCLEGSWMQTSGRCGTAAPPCVAAGGTCRESSEVGNGCLGIEPGGTGLLPTAPSANAECVTAGTGDVCCASEATCRGNPNVGCYVRGSDAAYVPPCTNGWFTCFPGDSPEIRIGE